MRKNEKGVWAAALALLLALGLTACGEKGPQPFEAEKPPGR